MPERERQSTSRMRHQRSIHPSGGYGPRVKLPVNCCDMPKAPPTRPSDPNRACEPGPSILRIDRGEGEYPETLRSRLGAGAPEALVLIGDKGLLRARKTALFCSARTPGDAILRAHDAAKRMRDDGVTVISGFHSPIEKECLQILLRGKQPIIVCPARAIQTMRIPVAYRDAFEAGRVLFLSPFGANFKRVTEESAARRNEFVAALADMAYIPHVSPSGKTAEIAKMLRAWKVPLV